MVSILKAKIKTAFIYFVLSDVIENFSWKPKENELKPLTLKPFVAIFIICGGFYLIAIFLFFMEVMKRP